MTKKWLIVVLAAVAAVTLVACASSEEPAAPAAPAPGAPAAPAAPGALVPPQQPAQPLPAAPAQAAVIPTVVPTPPAAPAPIPARPVIAPRPAEGPHGTLTLALPTVGSPIFVNGLAPYPRGIMRTDWGMCETLAGVNTDDATIVESRLALKWEVAADMSDMTFHLREGVQFHKGNGEMTAEDVAFSYNNAGADNSESTAGGGAQLLVTWDRWFAQDRYTVVAPFDTPESNPKRWGFIHGGESSAHCILSKTVFDTVGEEAAVTTLVATGPWDAQSWTAGVDIQADAVVDHWRITPGFAQLRMLEIPEQQTRVALMRTNRADIAELSLKNIKALAADGFDVNDTLRNFYHAAVFVGGNYWYDPEVHTFQGTPVDARAGFKPDDDHPWIGNPRDPERHERAKKVRQAMSMAIDREAIAETILGGLAPVSYIPGIPVVAPEWEDKWVVPFDPQGAKSLMVEAGYPNGFEFEFWIPSDFPNVDVEVAQAIVAMWKNVGIDANPLTIAYTAGRPNLMTKEQDAPWMWFMVGDGVNYASAHLRSATYLSHGQGWNGSVEIPDLESFQNRWQGLEGDREAQLDVWRERADWLREWMPFITVADIPKLWVTNPDTVMGWKMYPHLEPGTVNNLEVAQPVR